MDAEESESPLVRRAVTGDAVALKFLLTQYRPRIRDHVARRIPRGLQGGLDPEDIVQDALIEAFKHIATFEPRGPGAFGRWLTTIALRRLRDAIKRLRAAKRGSGRIANVATARAVEDSMVALLDLVAGPGRTPSQSVARDEAVAAVRSALAELSDDYRQAVGLVYIQGLSTAAAAAEMGRTERAIESLCYKAKGRLREVLGSRSRFLSNSE